MGPCPSASPAGALIRGVSACAGFSERWGQFNCPNIEIARSSRVGVPAQRTPTSGRTRSQDAAQAMMCPAQSSGVTHLTGKASDLSILRRDAQKLLESVRIDLWNHLSDDSD